MKLIPKVGQKWKNGRYWGRWKIVRVQKHWWYGIRVETSLSSELYPLKEFLKHWQLAEDVVERRYINRCLSNTQAAPNVEVVTLMHSMKEAAPSVLAAAFLLGAGSVLTWMLIVIGKSLLEK